MRKSLMILTVLFLLTSVLKAQESLVQLHPLLGDTISQNEKRLFLLFPNTPDSTFEFAFLRLKNDDYTLSSKAKDGRLVNEKLSADDVAQYRLNVEKLLMYYAKMDTSATKLNDLTKDEMMASSSVRPLNKSINLSIEQRKMLAREARRYSDLKAEGMDSGLWGQDLDNFIKTSGSWSIPVVGVMLKSAVTQTDPFVDKVIYRKK